LLLYFSPIPYFFTFFHAFRLSICTPYLFLPYYVLPFSEATPSPQNSNIAQ
jgi:hypothetical protein